MTITNTDAFGNSWYHYNPCEGHPTGSGCYKFRILEADIDDLHMHARHNPDSVRALLDRIFQLTCAHSAEHKLDGWLIARWILPPAVTAHGVEYTPTLEEQVTLRAVDNVMDMRYRYNEHGKLPPEQRARFGGDNGLFMTFLKTYAEKWGYKMYPPDGASEWPYLDLMAGRD